MILDLYEKQGLTYDNRNGRVLDSVALEKERKFVCVWTEEEKAVFKQKLVPAL